jgi:aryl-alcohol dehydrogenase-like predicted oxidoreductase
VFGDPIDVNRLGPALIRKAREFGVTVIYYDPFTDGDLARQFRRAEKVTGRDYADASAAFVHRTSGKWFVVDDPEAIIAADLARTVRHASTHGTYIATKASADESNTAAEAAIRAVWRASNPVTIEPARIH